MNVLFLKTPEKGICGMDMIQAAIDYIVNFTADTYAELLYQLPENKKKFLLLLIKKEKLELSIQVRFVNVMDWHPQFCQVCCEWAFG